MTWIDRIENTVFTITTGDGKVYTPLWKSGETSKEFNASVYNFINLPGVLVDRKQVSGRQFPMVFWFQGDDNIEQSDAFDISANDSRAWTVRHPQYGDITGQPVKLSRNDANYNITEFNCDFWESIAGVFPKQSVSVRDAISDRFVTYSDDSAVDYESKVDLKPADISTITSISDKINAAITKQLDAVSYSDFIAAKNKSLAGVTNMILAPAAGMQTIHQVILQPALFGQAVVSRVNLIRTLYDSVKSIFGIKNNRNNKAYYESAGGATISAMAVAMINPLDADYKTRADIAAMSTMLQSVYNDYLQTLDNSYVDITDPDNSFSASNDTQVQIKTMVVEAISALSTLAFNAKQERLVILDRDSNLILLTHKYMGLDVDDNNLETFRHINNIKNGELLSVKKGRQIKYYV